MLLRALDRNCLSLVQQFSFQSSKLLPQFQAPISFYKTSGTHFSTSESVFFSSPRNPIQFHAQHSINSTQSFNGFSYTFNMEPLSFNLSPQIAPLREQLILTFHHRWLLNGASINGCPLLAPTSHFDYGQQLKLTVEHACFRGELVQHQEIRMKLGRISLHRILLLQCSSHFFQLKVYNLL